MQKKCLVLGGAGFIGKNLSMYLVSMGYDVTVYDLSVTNAFSEDELNKINYLERSFFEDNDLDSIVSGQDIVFHLISSVGPATSMVNPEKCYYNDVAKTVELLESMRRNDVKRMMFISSGGTVYGNKPCEKYSEDMTLYPRNHYGITKATIEKILLMYNEIYNMDNIVLRLSNPYGIGQMSKKGIGAVTVFAEKIINDEEICVWGDGTTVRDYIYIDDVVKMMEKFINHECKSEFEVYNIGTGTGISLNELIALLESCIGKKAKVVYEHNREIDAERNVLDMKKTFETIGNIIEYPIDKGINRYLQILNNKGDVNET